MREGVIRCIKGNHRGLASIQGLWCVVIKLYLRSTMSVPYSYRHAARAVRFQTAWRTALIVCSALTLSACLVDAENERFDEALGFYDVDAQGAPRPIRNDLSGGLSGMV